jgi:hypothetical protein
MASLVKITWNLDHLIFNDENGSPWMNPRTILPIRQQCGR